MIRAALLSSVLLLAVGCTGGKTERAVPPHVNGDAERGALVIREKGCGACHDIPGIRGANGVVGPPLANFSNRSFIGGHLPNSPENVIQWVMNPHAVDPKTAMPGLGLDLQQARDVTAYLYTLQ